MDAFVIEGGKPLQGKVKINGSKNAALPLMAAALLTDEKVELLGVPNLADIRNMTRLLGEMGCKRDARPGGFYLKVTDDSQTHARYEIVKTMRASVCVLGPTLARRGRVRLSMPGGCAIGQRPVDLHLRGLEALGAKIELDGGDIIATAPGGKPNGEGGRLRGAKVFLGGAFGPTVLGTANVMSAACLADGVTVIEGAACEPEVVDLARMLKKMGADIQGAGSPRITVRGKESLGGTMHAVIPDRIEAGTFVCAAAITGGDLVIEDCPSDALMAFFDRVQAAGVEVETLDETDPMRARIRVTRTGALKPVVVTTQPHPGFPTDLQAQVMALLTLADGHSVITERIFPERFLHVPELGRMGANVIRQGPTAVVSGVKELVGAPVMASDLRASAGLVLAGLAARGETVVSRVYHLDRGYETLEKRLAPLGAAIRRVKEGEEDGLDEKDVPVVSMSGARALVDGRAMPGAVAGA